MQWSEPAIWREPPRGAVIDPERMRLPGLEQLRPDAIGRPAMSHLTGLTFESASPGEAVFSLPLSDWLRCSHAAIPGGVFCLPADAAMGCAIQTELPGETPFTTAELSLTYLRQVHSGDLLRAEGRALHVGRTLGLSAAAIRDAQGRLIAYGTSRVTIFPAAEGRAGGRLGGTVPPHSGQPAYVASAADLPDPYLRPSAGAILEPSIWATRTGREILEAQISGDLPRQPLHHLLGLTAVEVIEDGVVRLAMPMTGWLATPWGWPQGGFIALLADAALADSVLSATPAGVSIAPVDLKVNFLRPVAGDGGLLTATARVLHQGRSLAVAAAEVLDAAGKRVALATGSSAILGPTR